MSNQFGLFDIPVLDAPDSMKRANLNFRPANMLTVHGIRDEGEIRNGFGRHSVSCVQCIEAMLHDGYFVRISGGGMDAPEDLPLGSVKAMFFDDHNGRKQRTGLCQRTYSR